MSNSLTLDHITEMMGELRAYLGRIVVIKIGGNSIAEDELFLSKICRQIVFLQHNGVQVILVHGGGPQIDEALYAKKIETAKGKDGRRITSPQAMNVIAQVMSAINRQVTSALVKEGCPQDKIFSAAAHKRPLVTAESLDPDNNNRSGKPLKVTTAPIKQALHAGKIIVLHSLGVGTDGKTLFNVNGDDYAMVVARAIKAKRLIMVTNVMGVLDKKGDRIPVLDPVAAKELIQKGVISGGMIPKVESALSVVKQGVGAVVIIDGFRPWAILAELMTRQGLGTLFRSRLS